jgi:hypothetical protein
MKQKMLNIGTRNLRRTTFTPRDGVKIAVTTYQFESVIRTEWRTYIIAEVAGEEKEVEIIANGRMAAMDIHEAAEKLIRLIGFQEFRRIHGDSARKDGVELSR